MEVFFSVSEESQTPEFPRGSVQGMAGLVLLLGLALVQGCCSAGLAATPSCGHKPPFGDRQRAGLCSQPVCLNAEVQRMGGAGMSS